MTSTEKLVAALKEAQAPAVLIGLAEKNVFNDYLSEHPAPCMYLLQTLNSYGAAAQKAGNMTLSLALKEIFDRAKEGEFDGTIEESNAWVERMKTEDPDTYKIIKDLKLERPIEPKTENGNQAGAIG